MREMLSRSRVRFRRSGAGGFGGTGHRWAVQRGVSHGGWSSGTSRPRRTWGGPLALVARRRRDRHRQRGGPARRSTLRRRRARASGWRPGRRRRPRFARGVFARYARRGRRRRPTAPCSALEQQRRLDAAEVERVLEAGRPAPGGPTKLSSASGRRARTASRRVAASSQSTRWDSSPSRRSCGSRGSRRRRGPARRSRSWRRLASRPSRQATPLRPSRPSASSISCASPTASMTRSKPPTSRASVGPAASRASRRSARRSPRPAAPCVGRALRAGRRPDLEAVEAQEVGREHPDRPGAERECACEAPRAGGRRSSAGVADAATSRRTTAR